MEAVRDVMFMRKIILAALGAWGFAKIFRINPKESKIVLIGGAAAWFGYEVMKKLGLNEFWALLFITVLVELVSEMIAKRKKSLSMIYAVPILIPFIPGGTLYYTLYYGIQNDEQMKMYGELLICQVGAMVLGILLAEAFFSLKYPPLT